ncbi:MAG: lactonase family protein [Candidatus Acidiferrales bacterium]
MKITRRLFAFLAFTASLAVLALAGAAGKPAERHSYLALVGTYTNKTDSKGIYAYEFDAETGKLTAKGLAVETPDPSFVAVHPNGRFVYAVNESGKESAVSAFALDAQSGKLTLLNQLPTLGEDPCYLAFDRTGKYVLIANYTSGNVVVFPILADGKLGEHTALLTDTGVPGPNKERQEGPHAHWIGLSARNRFAYVADLGLDRVLIYNFDAATGMLIRRDATPSNAEAGAAKPSDAFSATLSPGTGPRHVAFSPDENFMYVLGELQSTVTVFANGARETYRQIQSISTLPEKFSGRNDAAEIVLHPSGRWLYTSNRGQDTFAEFAVDPEKGILRKTGDFPTGGKEPRHFAFDPTGRFLLAENQHSNSIVVFSIDPTTGALTQVSKTEGIPSPVCLVFLPTP